MNGDYRNLVPDRSGPVPALPEPLLPFPGPLPPFPEPFPEPLPRPFPPPWPPREPIPVPWPPTPRLRNLRAGCYLLNYQPNGSPLIAYDGTLRVEAHGGGRTASGDLYQRPVIWLPPIPAFPPRPGRPILLAGPNPSAGIPVLSRSQYRYYLRVTQIVENITIGNKFTLGFEMWRFTKSSGGWSTGGTWNNEGAFSAVMVWQPAPSGYPSSADYLAGDLQNGAGTVVGRLTMGWVSPYLRKATIEIDRVAQSETTLNNGAGVDWRSIGDAIGWDITVDESQANIAEPSGEFWSDAEAHAEMLARRDASNLDAEWRYHVLCVRRLDSTERGIMYDAYGGDSNNIPREGCVISSHWTIPSTQAWGNVQGVRFGAAAGPYFRTAVHETGHAMGLYHNTVDNCFMNTTNLIADNSLAPGSAAFPNNIQWSYNGEDAKRLRHMPDIYVRPGGTPFGTSYNTTPISPTDFSVEVGGLSLGVTALLDSVPLGAPVRVKIELENASTEPVSAPASLSMKSGFVRGKVVDPTGAVRTFSPLLLCVDDHTVATLNPGTSIENDITLLRGAQGPLFPVPGLYRINVEVHWDSDGIEAKVTGEAEFIVTAAANEAHADAALKLLSTPDTLVTLVVGGDHLADGVTAIQTALENPVLRPHYAYIEGKRVARRFGKRRPDPAAARELIDDTTVMSDTERAKAEAFFDGARTAKGSRRKAKAKKRASRKR